MPTEGTETMQMAIGLLSSVIGGYYALYSEIMLAFAIYDYHRVLGG